MPGRALAPRLQKDSKLVWGVYILFALTVLLEPQYEPVLYPDDIGRFLPFFQDFATWTHVKGLIFSLAEIFMFVMLVSLAFRIMSSRSIRFDKGSLMRPLGFYMLMVALGELNGLATHGDLRLSLWEVRPQIYMLVAYILACNLVTTRRQINVLLWILMVGTALRGVQGLVRIQTSLGGNIHLVEAIFSHEQSFFFNAFLTLAPILFLYRGSRRLKALALVFLPFVLYSDLANQRRVGTLAILVAVVLLLLLTAVAHPARRRAAIVIAIVLAAAWFPYYEAFKNSTGLVGEVAHAVASSSHPDPRDASSNIYRINEDYDIMATMRSSSTSEVIGYGFGKPMQTPFPLANIGQADEFWNIMPHNSILWVWMRMGTIGYFLLWILIGTAIMQAAGVARRLKDPWLKGIAVWITLMIVQQIVFGYLDLQWENYRNMITLGILFALISRLAAFASEETQGDAGPAGTQLPAPMWARHPDLSPTLAVIDGRLVRRRDVS